MWIVDGHEDIAASLAKTGRDFAHSDPAFSLTLPGLKQGGVGLVLATVFAPVRGGLPKAPAEVQFQIYKELTERFPEDLGAVRNLEDLEEARGSGRIGLVLLLEGADPVKRVDELGGFHREGVRVVGLTWNHPNRYAGGVASKRGLTPEGRHLLEAMGDLSMVLDVSHLNRSSFWDCLERWEGPIAASHSNARAVVDHARNLDDEQIGAIAERGGVIGLNFYRGFLVPPEEKNRAATTEDLLRHAGHIAERGGEACLGLGTDFDGGFGPDHAVEGCARAGELKGLPDLLTKAGFSEEGVEGVLSGNWSRVLRAAL
ncbi:MAG: dipeptidase [Planctomycetota bacterium]|jgi:membrane dipeptidase